MRTLLHIGAALLLLPAGATGASLTLVDFAPSFDTAVDVSADGSTVVGYGNGPSGQEMFRWTAAGGAVGLGDLPGGSFGSYTFGGVSPDGSVVVGQSLDGPNHHAVSWTSGTGMVRLGGSIAGTIGDGAWALTPDTNVAVGAGFTNTRAYAARWVGGVGALLPDLPGATYSQARAVSDDGSVVVGLSTIGGQGVAVRWTSAGPTNLGDLPGGAAGAAAFDVSADGQVVVGYSFGASGTEAYRWTPGTGMVGLGQSGTAYGISSDGSVIVGEGGGVDNAFIWDETNGGRRLATVLAAQGVDVSGWQLRRAAAISDDGLTIVGYGTYGGSTRAFVAQLDAPAPPPPPPAAVPEPSSLLFALLSLLAGFGLRTRRS